MKEPLTSNQIADEVIETIRASCEASREDDSTEFFLSVRLICEELQARRAVETPSNQRVWEFDRYVDGRLKAEGVRISRAGTFEEACRAAVSLASPGSVLVLRRQDETSRRCGWFGEGRGQCLLQEGHETHPQTRHHTCEQDGRLLDVTRTGLAAVAEAQRCSEKATGEQS